MKKKKKEPSSSAAIVHFHIDIGNQRFNLPGLIPAPVNGPSVTIIVAIAMPTKNGTAVGETFLFFGFVIAKIQNTKKAVPNPSIKTASCHDEMYGDNT